MRRTALFRAIAITFFVLVCIAPASPLHALPPASSLTRYSATEREFAAPAFEHLWARADGPVATGVVSRSWLWGPAPGEALLETYAQARDGVRTVQYFDKARMELNEAITDERSPWRVTTGLLVFEMVSGRAQTGDRQFRELGPSNEIVAGDGGSSNPRYSDFQALARSRFPDRTGSAVGDTLSGRGKPTASASHILAHNLRFAAYIPETGHNIPDVLWNYMNESGPVLGTSGNLEDGRLLDWVYVLGYPITEPYWAEVSIAGKREIIMIQLFQRRTLTYVPSFPDSWQVQMGNVGQHYLSWRYGHEHSGGANGVREPRTPVVALAPSPVAGSFVAIKGSEFVYEGTSVKLKGTNYWLSSGPFHLTWAWWDGHRVQVELAKARELGINTIRVGIPFQHGDVNDVLWADESMTRVSPWIVSQMTQVLQIASAYDMKVIFVLFEWYDQQPAPGTPEERTNIAYVEGLVRPFAKDDRVLAWDLHNEPDFYSTWKSGRQDRVLEWLKRISGHVRRLDSHHPITIGVGDYTSLWHPASDGTTILSLVDFVAFHCYNAGALAGQIAQIKGRTSKPIVLEEFGWPTSSGAGPPRPGAVFDEATQNFLYRSMLNDSKQADLAGVIQWTLWDYVPGTAYRTDYEEHFGLVRLDGTLKPAAYTFMNNYPARVLPSRTRSNVPLDTSDKPNHRP